MGDVDVTIETVPAGDGWRCEVTVRAGGGETRHSVTVARDDLARLDPPGTSPEQLVRVSFEFLLEREPKESILRTFELPLIGRYFPEWEGEIRGRLGG